MEAWGIRKFSVYSSCIQATHQGKMTDSRDEDSLQSNTTSELSSSPCPPPSQQYRASEHTHRWAPVAAYTRFARRGELAMMTARDTVSERSSLRYYAPMEQAMPMSDCSRQRHMVEVVGRNLSRRLAPWSLVEYSFVGGQEGVRRKFKLQIGLSEGFRQ